MKNTLHSFYNQFSVIKENRLIYVAGETPEAQETVEQIKEAMAGAAKGGIEGAKEAAIGMIEKGYEEPSLTETGYVSKGETMKSADVQVALSGKKGEIPIESREWRKARKAREGGITDINLSELALRTEQDLNQLKLNRNPEQKRAVSNALARKIFDRQNPSAASREGYENLIAELADSLAGNPEYSTILALYEGAKYDDARNAVAKTIINDYLSPSDRQLANAMIPSADKPVKTAIAQNARNTEGVGASKVVAEVTPLQKKAQPSGWGSRGEDLFPGKGEAEEGGGGSTQVATVE